MFELYWKGEKRCLSGDHYGYGCERYVRRYGLGMDEGGFYYSMLHQPLKYIQANNAKNNI
jgi:hypothetical protein